MAPRRRNAPEISGSDVENLPVVASVPDMPPAVTKVGAANGATKEAKATKKTTKRGVLSEVSPSVANEVAELTAQLEKVMIEKKNVEALLEEKEASLIAKEVETTKLEKKVKEMKKASGFKPSIVMESSALVKETRMAKKDANKPRHPRSAYQLWAMDNDEVKEIKSLPERSKLLGEMWKTVTQEEKKPYEAKAQQEKTKFEKAMLEYRQVVQVKQEMEEAVQAVGDSKRTENALKLLAEWEEFEKVQEEGKKKSSKKSRDPEMPKRPLSAYIEYCNSRRAQLSQNDNEEKLSNTEAIKTFADEWNKMGDAEKAKYTEIAYQNKVVYEKEMEEYKSGKAQEEAAVKAEKELEVQKVLAVKAVEQKEKARLERLAQLERELLEGKKKEWEVEQAQKKAEKALKRKMKAGQPKRPGSGYNFYLADVRQSVAEKNPELSARELFGACASGWKELDDAAKKQYNDKARAEMVEYKEKMAMYRMEHPDAESCMDTASVADSMAANLSEFE